MISLRSFEALNKVGITGTAPKDDQRIQHPGYREPSELLRELRRLRRAPFGEGLILNQLWLQRFPPHVALA